MAQESSELHSLFTKPNEPFAPREDSNFTEELPEDLKNRHIRRLEAKLQAERESNIAMAARVEALADVDKLRNQASGASWEEKARRIYGDDKPENAQATSLLVDAIREATESAKNQALEEARREMRERQNEEARENQTVNSYIEKIEDTYGVDFTSSEQARERQKAFRDLWYRLSPKDEAGEVKDYADPFEVFEIYKSQNPNIAKDYASRGMTRSGQVQGGTIQDDAVTKYLQENGIIDPF